MNEEYEVEGVKEAHSIASRRDTFRGPLSSADARRRGAQALRSHAPIRVASPRSSLHHHGFFGGAKIGCAAGPHDGGGENWFS